MDEKKIENLTNQNWTLVFGTDKGYTGRLYHYIEIKEFPSFVYCAPTRDIALANYKKQLKLTIQIMLELGDKIPAPGEYPTD